jgi:hypothetical protein
MTRHHPNGHPEGYKRISLRLQYMGVPITCMMFRSGLMEKGRHVPTLPSLQPPRLTRTLALLSLFSHLKHPVNGRPRYGRRVSIAERGFHRRERCVFSLVRCKHIDDGREGTSGLVDIARLRD